MGRLVVRLVVRLAMWTINLGLLNITGGSKLREKTTKFLRVEIVGDGEENGGDEGELETPGLPADSHGRRNTEVVARVV